MKTTLTDLDSFNSAVARDDWNKARALLNDYPDLVSFRDLFGLPLLRTTTEAGQVEVVKLLLEYGADVNDRGEDGNTPLHRATKLHKATKQCYLEIVKLLLEYGADVNARNKDGNTPLRFAFGEPVMMKLLLAHGADVNAKYSGSTLLHYACRGAYSVAGLLLDSRSDVDVNATDSSLDTPLHRAVSDPVSHESKDAAELLLARGADVSAKNASGDTPLHVAVSKRYKDWVALLLASNAEVNAKNNKGSTSLHLATVNGDTGLVELLLANGADVNVKDNDGYTPLYEAQLSGYEDLAALLMANGADADTKGAEVRALIHQVLNGTGTDGKSMPSRDRLALAVRLFNTKDTRAVGALAWYLRIDDGGSKLASVLEKAKDSFALQIAIKGFHETHNEHYADSYRVHSHARGIISGIKSSHTLDALIAASADWNDEVRRLVLDELGKPPEPNPIDAIISALSDSVSEIRARAAEYLGQLGDQRAVEPLRRMLYDPEEPPRTKAKKALVALGQTNLPMGHGVSPRQARGPDILLTLFSGVSEIAGPDPSGSLIVRSADFLPNLRQ